MTSVKYLGAGLLLISAIFILLINRPSIPIASKASLPAPTIKAMTSYKAPEALSKATRPLITVDESQHPRWVKSLEESSLRGTQVDRVVLEPQADGSLDLKPGILVYFDYFLSLQGEMSNERIQQLLYDDIFANFSEPTATQLYHLLSRYMKYSKAMDDYLSKLTHEDVRAQALSKKSVEQSFQSQYFSSAEMDRIFAKYDDMLSFRSQGRAQSQKIQQYTSTAKESRFAVATELFGAETASRLQQLEQQEERWQQRLKDYQQQKQQISYAPLDIASQQAAIANLKNRLFSASEQVRVRKWEKFIQSASAE